MSRLYFSSPTDEVELSGPERHWLNHLAAGPARAAYDLDSSRGLERCAYIMAMIPEVPDDPWGPNYLHVNLRAAVAEDAANKAAWDSKPAGSRFPIRDYNPDPLRRLESSLALRICGSSAYETKFLVAGQTLGAADILLNTALAAGSDPIRLAAKLSGWDFCLVEGEDRAWLADIIDEGLAGGMLRRTLGDWADLGWPGVAEFLRSSNAGPVVTHHSTGDSFLTSEVAGWEVELPDDWKPTWATAEDGLAEWAFSDETKAEERNEGRAEQWYDPPSDERWRLALDGLRAKRPWCRLAPDTLSTVRFGMNSATAYDLVAPDREARVLAGRLGVEA